MASKVAGVKRKRLDSTTDPPVVPSHLSQASPAGLAKAIEIYESIRTDWTAADQQRVEILLAGEYVDLGTVVEGHTLLYYLVKADWSSFSFFKKLPQSKLTRQALLDRSSGGECALSQSVQGNPAISRCLLFADAVTVDDIMTEKTIRGATVFERLVSGVFRGEDVEDREANSELDRVAAEVARRLPSRAFTPDVIRNAALNQRGAVLGVIFERLPDVDILSFSILPPDGHIEFVTTPSRDTIHRLVNTAKWWMTMYFAELPSHVAWSMGRVTSVPDELVAVVMSFLEPASRCPN